MSTAEPTNEAHNLSSMADDVLRAVLARAVFDDQAALKRVCKRFLAVITSRSFREERRASGCLEHTVLVLKYTEGQHWDWKHICWLLRQPAKDSKTGNRAWRPENSDEAENPRGVLSRSIAEGPARSLHVGNCRIPWWTEVSGGSWTTLVAMRTNQYTTPIFAFDGEGAFARKSFAGLPCGGPGGMAWGLATLG